MCNIFIGWKELKKTGVGEDGKDGKDGGKGGGKKWRERVK